MLIFLHAFFSVSQLFPFWQVHLPFYLFLSSCISFLRISLLFFTFFPFILHVYLFIYLFLIVYICVFSFQLPLPFLSLFAVFGFIFPFFALPYFNLMFFSFYSFLSFRFFPSLPFSRFALRFPFFFYLLSIFFLTFPPLSSLLYPCSLSNFPFPLSSLPCFHHQRLFFSIPSFLLLLPLRLASSSDPQSRHCDMDEAIGWWKSCE